MAIGPTTAGNGTAGSNTADPGTPGDSTTVPGEDPRAARLLGAAEAFMSAAAALDPGSWSGAECAAVADACARVEKAAGALRLLAGARAVAAGMHKAQGCADPVHWMARKAGTTRRDARQGLLLAKALEAHRATKEALVGGEVSIAQAHEIAKTLDTLPDAEPALLAAACTGDLAELQDA